MQWDRSAHLTSLYPGSEWTRTSPDTALTNQHPRFSILPVERRVSLQTSEYLAEAMILPESDHEMALILTMKRSFQWW